jgi:hypothetical protein
MAEHYRKGVTCEPCLDGEHATTEHILDNDGKYVSTVCLCCEEEV